MSKVEERLLEIKAVFLSPKKPFTWASGIISPIYCDNRLIFSYPEIRHEIETALAKLVSEKFSNAEILMGTATAGIPHAAYVSEYLNLPMGYVRSSSKDHGRNNQIEGHYEEGNKVVVIEDLISTGKSSIEVIKALKEANLEVLGCVSIFSYGFQEAKEAFDKVGVPYYSLANFNELVQIASELNYIDKEDLSDVLEWRKAPREWRK